MILTAIFGALPAASAASSAIVSRAEPGGSIGIQLLTGPAAALQDPRARLYIVDYLHPGTTIHRKVEVSNTTTSRQRIVIYAAAAAIGGGRFVGDAGHTPNALSTWTSVTPNVSDLPAGHQTTVTVSIAVPRDASPGEQYGVVWAEVRSAPVSGVGITQINRVGVRLYLAVGPGGPPPSRFRIKSLSARRAPDGQPMVVATVANTGGRALDMSGTLQLSNGPGGLRAGPFAADLGVTLAIGDTEPITIGLDKRLPDGPWNALVTLHSGLISGTAHATISFPAVSAPGSSPPYPLIVGLLALLLSGIAAARIITGHRPDRRPVAGASP